MVIIVSLAIAIPPISLRRRGGARASGLRSNGGVGAPEPRKGGGAKACSVELAERQSGRASWTIVQKGTVQKDSVQRIGFLSVSFG